MIPSRSDGRSAAYSASVVEPPLCEHAARCGGCPLIGLPYPAQLERKRARAQSAFAPYPELASLELPALIAADTLETYRVRAKLVVGAPARVGLYSGAAHDVIDIPRCRVLAPSLLRTTEVLRALLREPPEPAGPALVPYARAGRGALAALDLREATGAGGASAVLATLILVRERTVQAAQLRAAADALMQAAPEVRGVAVSYKPAHSAQVLGSQPELVAGASHAADSIGGVVHQARFGAFVQAHRDQAAKLHAVVAAEIDAALGGLEGRHVLELYAGSGAIGLALAQRGARVTLVEQQRAAAEAARSAAQESGRAVRVLARDAGEALAELARRREDVDAVVVDPPRRGLSVGGRLALAALRPKALAYVSCSPVSLARDLAHLHRLGLRTRSVRALDLMPLSDEVECVALLGPADVPLPAVLFESSTLIAVDKPSHEPTTPQGEHTGSLLDRVRRLAGCAAAVPIHRLDVDTSGVCLFARAPETVAGHAAELAAGEKRYLALVRGIAPKKGVINRPVREAGRELAARTRYRRLAIHGGHSLLVVLPDQGRKHQIRKHLASIGHPVIGDARYGHPATNRHFEERHGLQRTFLHCQSIALATASQPLELISPLPGELTSLLKSGLGAPSQTESES